MYPIYRYKLNAEDFVKMYLGDLTQIQSYLFYQIQPIELEIHLEEVLMSTKHSKFPELGLGEFATKYRTPILNMTKAVIGGIEKEEGKEYIKLILTSTPDILTGLVGSYLKLIKYASHVQDKLLASIGTSKSPITIVTNSFILNRLSTISYGYRDGIKIPISENQSADTIKLSELQLRNLIVNQVSLTERDHEDIESLRGNPIVSKYLNIYRNARKGYSESVAGQQFANGILTISLYNSILKMNHDYGWESNKLPSELAIPHFNHISRKVKADWSGHVLQAGNK